MSTTTIFASLLNDQPGTSTTVANTTSGTDLSPSSYRFPPLAFVNQITAFRITAWGAFSTTGTPTLGIRADIGTLIGGWHLGNSGAVTTPSGASGAGWHAEWNLVGGNGNAVFHSVGVFKGLGGSNSVIVATDTAGTLGSPPVLNVYATWGTASPSNTITCYGLLVEQLN